jgi:hypothetical protein
MPMRLTSHIPASAACARCLKSPFCCYGLIGRVLFGYQTSVWVLSTQDMEIRREKDAGKGVLRKVFRQLIPTRTDLKVSHLAPRIGTGKRLLSYLLPSPHISTLSIHEWLTNTYIEQLPSITRCDV